MLQLKQISKTFFPGTAEERIALRGIKLELQPGDFVTVIGSNGAGKSTLLNVIAGVLQPDQGSVVLAGKDVTRWPEYERSKLIGRVFQDPMAGTAPRMTIEENLVLAWTRAEKRGLGKGVTKTRQAQFRKELSGLHLGLEDRMTTKVGVLSGGERQALSLLMATFTKPQLLLLDEHTAALDPARAHHVIQLTEQLVQNHHLTTLMITHNMQQAIQVGNRLIMMDQGEIVFQAEGEEKQALTIERLMEEFRQLRGKQWENDRMVLSSKE
ncbi:ABC transporter ATP-binding protein [Rubeoparvulum massiliense]|uniref:ABC transporter ATP-binding protein n=1 Tax=Rubeoparvulum massiliense TaxID=1631346 RepID=UPI00065E448B|nr:ABC transporter ATP-binding protein [Rubeoparvulum massiliense]